MAMVHRVRPVSAANASRMVIGRRVRRVRVRVARAARELVRVAREPVRVARELVRVRVARAVMIAHVGVNHVKSVSNVP